MFTPTTLKQQMATFPVGLLDKFFEIKKKYIINKVPNIVGFFL